METWTMLVAAVALFFAGWGWGQFWAVWHLQQESAKAMKGRLQITMPINPDDAAAAMDMLSLMVRQVEQERKARAKLRGES